MYSKEFNNCYILLSNISQALENTKFIAGELSLIVSLVLYCPTSVYVPEAAHPRGHAGGGTDQSGHQQRTGSHPAEPFHRRLSRTAGGREYRRRGDAGGVTGQPDHFPGIHKAHQGADGAVHGTVLRHQLRLSRRPVGSHDTLDAVK